MTGGGGVGLARASAEREHVGQATTTTGDRSASGAAGGRTAGEVAA